MKPFLVRSIFALALSVLLLAPISHAAMSRGFNELLDAVVRIDVREFTFEAGARRFGSSIGSGVILSDDGLILTNAHVVSPRAVEVLVTLANLERVTATLVGWDHWTDLAVLRLDLPELRRRKLQFKRAEFGDSSKVGVGETVYAVGTPFGLTRTATRGIVSNNNRYFEDSRGVNGYETGTFNTWLQTDAAINPGNSGGPLVTGDGRVVGINSRGYAGADNLGFAIPANIAKHVMAELVKSGRVTRSYVGIVPRDLRDFEGFYALSLNTGLLINNVDRDSPAARAGIRGGDILLAINGTKVDGRFPEQLPPIQNLIASQPVGSQLKLSVKRGSDTRDYAVTTENLESRVGDEWAFDKWGISVRKVSRTYARENQLPDTDGVLVIGVQPGYPANVAGVARGDVLTKVNQQPIDTLDVLKRAHTAYETAPEPVLVEVMRHRQISLVVFKP
ncbi:MAG: trypsin-like peptidase domain-containing protein [Opitutus sp.]